MKEPTVRSFVAIELPGDVALGLSQSISSLKRRLPGSDIRWVAPGNIHVTLKFLGDVRLSSVDDVRCALEEACATSRRINLCIRELGAFPSARLPRIVWAGLEGDIEPLVSLVRQVDAALEPLGFAKESRPFTPHLTLARVRDGASSSTTGPLGALLAGPTPFDHLNFEAASATLMKSQLTSSGAVYSRVAVLPLGPRRPAD